MYVKKHYMLQQIVSYYEQLIQQYIESIEVTEGKLFQFSYLFLRI